MADWALVGGRTTEREAGATANGVQATAHATINTKGSWVELIASTAQEMDMIILHLSNQSGSTNRDFLVDIGIGGAGSETVLFADLIYSGAGVADRTPVSVYAIPCRIPKGVRLSARCQCTVTVLNLSVSVVGVRHDFLPFSGFGRLDTFGAVTGDSGGTSIDPGGTINTKGAWVQLVASTTYPIRGLILGFGNNLMASRANAHWKVDIAVGAAASEAVVLGDYPIFADSSMDLIVPGSSPFIPCVIPPGSRIAGRAMSTNSGVTTRIFDLVAYAVS